MDHFDFQGCLLFASVELYKYFKCFKERLERETKFCVFILCHEVANLLKIIFKCKFAFGVGNLSSNFILF